jgi:hypothetical protein
LFPASTFKELTDEGNGIEENEWITKMPFNDGGRTTKADSRDRPSFLYSGMHATLNSPLHVLEGPPVAEVIKVSDNFPTHFGTP